MKEAQHVAQGFQRLVDKFVMVGDVVDKVPKNGREHNYPGI